jgi:hypothetical protein
MTNLVFEVVVLVEDSRSLRFLVLKLAAKNCVVADGRFNVHMKLSLLFLLINENLFQGNKQDW